MKNKKLYVIAAVAIVIAILIAIGKGKETGIVVNLSKPSVTTITESIPCNGKIQPVTEVKISPDVSGEIVQLEVESGDTIRKGDLLLRIKPDIYISNKERAEASLNSSKAQYLQQKANLAQAELDHKRNTVLYNQKAISQSEYEKSLTQLEIVVSVVGTTPAKPVPTRIESDLFTSLLGEWEVSYSLIQFNNVEVGIKGAKVTIAAGTDDNSAEYYRSYNRLVIQGWPFNVWGDGTHEPMPYYSPADLKDASSYWANNPQLAERDCGPKIFLEIGKGGVVTVPSSKYEYFYNWSEDGEMNFFGADIQNGWTAPATFPVTISEDGNTITIGACHSGEEFGYGIYRPAVFRYGTEPWALATSDIVLKRVK
ncbi:MAG: biotin/lipoyl-binding protein [Bacteroidales bacterium]|nr:biotin/lipoyl-binding protein [Bacteroidales bacterium]